MTSPSFSDQIAVVKLSENKFVSKVHPKRLANVAPIAYGGCTASVAVHSACHTVPPTHHLASILGAFHGPTRIDRPVNCTVTRTRDTKTFATRRVVASQTLDDGSERTCAEVTCDFHVLEPALLTYSAPPSRTYGDGPLDPKTTRPTSEIVENLVDAGHITRQAADAFTSKFTMYQSFFDERQCTDGVSAQNLMGVAKHIVTTQDQLSITDKTSAEYIKFRETFSSERENAAALSFLMDASLSFLPLNLDHKNFDDCGACSTLDFAMRIMRPLDRLDGWFLRERKTIAAGAGRTYSEARLWDEQGRIVAVHNQNCIARVPPSAPVNRREDEKERAKI